MLAAIEAAAAVGIAAEIRGAKKHPLRHLSRCWEEPFLLAGARHLRFPGDRQRTPPPAISRSAPQRLTSRVPGKIQDPIAIPKNGYHRLAHHQSAPSAPGQCDCAPTRCHIAETGVALTGSTRKTKTLSELQHKTTSWLRSLLELQNASGDSAEFLEHVKI